MPKPGDRIVVEGTKVGGARREGTLLELSGSLMRVRWEGGAESYLSPGAGAVRFLSGTSKSKAATKAPAKTAVKSKTAQKPAAKAKKKR